MTSIAEGQEPNPNNSHQFSGNVSAFENALTISFERIKNHHSSYGLKFPTVAEDTTYQLFENETWVAGFWTGLLWLTYSATKNEPVLAQAKALLPTFSERLEKRVRITHDLGFLYTLSARPQWQLTGDETARQLALQAADDLVARYRTPGKYIQAWGPVGDADEGGRIIIDTMLNLPLLFWATQQTGDSRYHQAAYDHAEISRQHLVRPDGSSYHTFLFNQQTGQPIGPRTHQGYADDSLWARGQGWTIYGFALAAEWCQEERFLDTSRLATQRFMAELPEGDIPWWDLRLPENAPHDFDTSAGAIAAGGMLRLARLVDDAEANELRNTAQRLLQALVNSCLETRPEAQGILRKGTLHMHKEWGLKSSLIFGDYFFVEALLALLGNSPDFWGPKETWQ